MVMKLVAVTLAAQTRAMVLSRRQDYSSGIQRIPEICGVFGVITVPGLGGRKLLLAFTTWRPAWKQSTTSPVHRRLITSSADRAFIKKHYSKDRKCFLNKDWKYSSSLVLQVGECEVHSVKDQSPLPQLQAFTPLGPICLADHQVSLSPPTLCTSFIF